MAWLEVYVRDTKKFVCTRVEVTREKGEKVSCHQYSDARFSALYPQARFMWCQVSPDLVWPALVVRSMCEIRNDDLDAGTPIADIFALSARYTVPMST